MSIEIRVPTLGESVTEATVAKWLKKTGDAVAADEPLVELETDKVSVEVPAPAAGRLDEIVAKEGETVGRDALLATMTEGEAGAEASKAKNDEPKAEESATEEGGAEEKKAALKTEEQPKPVEPAKAKPAGGGVKSKSEVLAEAARGVPAAAAPVAATAAPAPVAAAAPRAPVPAEDAEREERVRMTRLRQTIARRLKDAQNTAAMLTTYNEVDMSAIMGLRNEYKDEFQKKHGVKLGFMSFFTKACVHALNEVPTVNAEIDGTDIVYKNFVHMGVAVGTPSGLVVPVLRNAHEMSFAEIEKTINDLGVRARDGKLSMADMQGGTFTISNGGVYGSLMSSPILNPPQSGILGMHKIMDRPMVVGGEIVARPMMYLALSYDHRIVDGKEAVTFLVRVKDALEDPRRLLMDL
ncbi:2-oxoglutarate dehydrogenase complex dihydrolipoyllysine-residue succinyltransferase [Pikeienuella piscinae]|uniref:Dihydrolipoyllysine-residue succinyltransferase n=1 Tax=Pikeienuella piscinae TaxID=2748098 RepID=A0A7L5C0C5_9RHOB|nr:2-oxoglutarate dehydrogenase complex dihydrolipoyllysine-residue succinyltransferase [Pikeienuella piscinae]QIE56833.1 2-oxoglutarate dehydrogenase complex dihydrolipoyllysine-residue succinyltransferase [Pikeienuella piscinae]